MNLFELFKPHELDQAKQDLSPSSDRMQDPVFKAYDHEQEKNPFAYISDVLKKRGFSLIGAGTFGAVFEHSEYPYVLKIFYKDSGYRKYVEFCKRNQDNPYLPEVKGAPTRLKGTDFYFVRLELLQPVKQFGMIAGLRLALTEMLDEDSDISWDEISRIYPLVDLEYVRDIADFINSQLSTYQVDIHMENFMIRPGSNDPVLTDPLVNLDYLPGFTNYRK